MLANYVALQHAPGGARAGLREINGHDEQSVGGTDTLTAIQLLDRLLIGLPGTSVGPGSAASLTASDRDRLLAAVYGRTYGPRIEGTVQCSHCGELFDLDFSLKDLLADLQPEKSTAAPVRMSDGSYALPEGQRFRLPTGQDEIAVCHLSPMQAERELLARCVVESEPDMELDLVQEAMRAVAPILDLELEATCPECGGTEAIHFDIQSYLLSAIKSQNAQLARDVHRLAMAYGWALDDILGLSRSRRLMHVALIEAETERPRR